MRRFVVGRGGAAVLALTAIGGVGQSLQFERLADGTERDLNGASSDLSAMPVVALLDPVSEPEKDPSSETTGIIIMLMCLHF
jgi:hypothetical protein